MTESMLITANVVGALVLLLLSLRMSAFFSGSETGFYRLSRLRLSIDAQSGDRVANQLFWFSEHPEHFVATALIGNNIANYLATTALGLIAVALFPTGAGTVEIVLTLIFAPLIFIWGELIPKSIYFRAPMHFMARHAAALTWWYRGLRPISLPLTLITRLVERLGNPDRQPLELVLGRKRLVHVLSQGHRAGLLTDAQNRLIERVMEVGKQSVTEAMTPVARVLGLPVSSSCQDVADFAERYSLSHVMIRHSDEPEGWYGYVRAVGLVASNIPLAESVQPAPSVDVSTGKLEALQTLREASAMYGLVRDGDKVCGVVTNRGLVAQLFRPRT